MTARVIDIAEYRRQKKEAAKPVSPLPTPAALTFWPILSPYGWFLVPMILPVAADRPVHV